MWHQIELEFIESMSHAWATAVAAEQPPRLLSICTKLLTVVRELGLAVLAMGAGSRSEAPQTMNGDDRLLVTDAPVEVQDLRKITRNFREIYWTCSNLTQGETERCPHVTGKSWKHQDFDQSCPKSSPGTDPPQRERAIQHHWSRN